MDQNPRTSLDREKVLLWTAIIGLLKVLGELVIKAVSYGRRNTELQVQLSPQR